MVTTPAVQHTVGFLLDRREAAIIMGRQTILGEPEAEWHSIKLEHTRCISSHSVRPARDIWDLVDTGLLWRHLYGGGMAVNNCTSFFLCANASLIDVWYCSGFGHKSFVFPRISAQFYVLHNMKNDFIPLDSAIGSVIGDYWYMTSYLQGCTQGGGRGGLGPPPSTQTYTGRPKLKP